MRQMVEEINLSRLTIEQAMATRSYLAREDGKFTGRKKLLWDGDTMKITNYDYANQFVKRQYNGGYSL